MTHKLPRQAEKAFVNYIGTRAEADNRLANEWLQLPATDWVTTRAWCKQHISLNPDYASDLAVVLQMVEYERGEK